MYTRGALARTRMRASVQSRAAYTHARACVCVCVCVCVCQRSEQAELTDRSIGQHNHDVGVGGEIVDKRRESLVPHLHV